MFQGRRSLGDFGIPIAIVVMVVIDVIIQVTFPFDINFHKIVNISQVLVQIHNVLNLTFSAEDSLWRVYKMKAY